MTNQKGIWEKEYSKVDNLWGFKPKDVLMNYESLVSKDGKVLDLGMGEGRNAFYFASMGYNVEGIDISETAINRCVSYAQEKGLKLNAEVADLVSFPIQENTYSLIILSNVLNFFNDSEICVILDKAKKGLKENGLIYINVFDPNDPSFEKHVKMGQKVTDFTFYRQKSDSYIHYFTMDELNQYFAGYKTITTSQSFFIDLGHGQPHYHGIIEMLLQKN